MTRAGGVDLPGDVAGQVAVNELVIHGWDVARASGQAYEVDDASLEVANQFYSAASRVHRVGACHAAVSTWLKRGRALTQVAEWAGHSVDVLLRVSAKCLDGAELAALRRIDDALSG
jgi:hypothetical protein